MRRTTIPCLHEGPDMPWDQEGTHYQQRRRWHRCLHPEQPLGEVVCGGMGCGPGCTGYTPCPGREPTLGLVPLWVKRYALPQAGAFNASIMPYRNGYLLAYRTQPPGSHIHLAQLADDFTFLGERELQIKHPRASLAQEDPRLFMHKGKVHVAFCGVEPWEEHPHKIKASVLYARLTEDCFVERTFYPHYRDRCAWEKNWAFFSAHGKLYCVYTIKPHVVFEVEDDRIVDIFRTENPLPWAGGHLRGGACPIYDPGGPEYAHFFHGRVGAYNETIYNTGVYTFDPEPPFCVRRMTRDPIQWADPEGRSALQMNGAAVVFVGGAVLHVPVAESSFWVAAQGVNDREVELVGWRDEDIQEALGEVRPMPVERPPLPPVYALYCDEIPERKEHLAAHLADRGVAVRGGAACMARRGAWPRRRSTSRARAPSTPASWASCWATTCSGSTSKPVASKRPSSWRTTPSCARTSRRSSPRAQALPARCRHRVHRPPGLCRSHRPAPGRGRVRR